MKKLILLCATILGLATCSHADTITLWNFNSPANDGVFTTGTWDPFIGSGTLTNIGGSANSFGSPANGGQTATSDTNTTDNSALRLAAFPAQSTANKTAGIEFFVSTVGYEGIQVIFDQENSATASQWWRVQYTTNGTTWIDHIVLQSALGVSWLKARVVDFSTVAGVKNNPNFGFRYVSEWVSTATGSGADSYTGNSGNYGTGGTIWFDMVTVSGTVLDLSNNDPTITSISNQTVLVNQSIGPIPFTIGDVESSPANLALSFSAANPGLFSNQSFDGTGTNRTLSLTPTPNQSGSSMVTVTVTDEGGKGASTTFTVAVIPPSVIVSNQTMRVNTSRTIGVQIANYASFLGPVDVTADSVILPPGSLSLSGSGSNRSLTITPPVDEIGAAIINVTATDGALTATATVFLNVVSSNTVAFWDFNSPIRDLNVQTGSTNSNIGNGIAKALVAVGSFGTAGTTADLDGQDNSRLRLGDTLPPQDTGNKTAGVEFRFSTVGFQDIEFSWEHYNSATASRHWRVQYSTDGVNFIDGYSYSNVVVTTFFPVSTSFAGLPGVDNNPNFAVRLVSEFESTAVSGSVSNYVGVQASGAYGTGGTLWLDTILFTGSPFTGVTQATLTVSRSGNDVLISWPSSISGTLHGTLSLTAPDWQPVSETPVVQGDQNVVTIVNPTGNKFYRLNQ